MVEPTFPRETVRVRKVPKFAVFLVLGAGLGILAAAILTFVFQGTQSVSPSTGLVYTDGQVFGFLALICIVIGMGIFGVLALVLDRVFTGRAREYRAEHETIHDASTGSATDGASSRSARSATEGASTGSATEGGSATDATGGDSDASASRVDG